MTAISLSRLEHRALEAAGLGRLRDKVVAGERLDREDGLALYGGADLLAIGALANRVREARHGDAVEPGQVLLAPAGIHTRLVRSRAGVEVSLEEEPSEALHRPSANVLMSSAAEVYGALAVGVVLTGMGSDGTEGLRAIRQRGGLTLAEAEETCVIFGMPKAAIEAGVIERTLPLDRIAAEILGAV